MGRDRCFRWSMNGKAHFFELAGRFGMATLLGAVMLSVGCRPAASPDTAMSEAPASQAPETDSPPAAPDETRDPRADLTLTPVAIELPAPAFRGTPVPREVPFVEEPAGDPRPPFLAPKGTENLARGKRVTSSDPAPRQGQLDYVTNGDKEATDFGVLELGPGTQWLQIDLEHSATLFGLVVWHQHAEARVYHDVVVQISDDPDFLEPVTVFNNDYNHTSGLGIGSDWGYVETSEGRLIDCRGVEGRYVRLYSRGNHLDEFNHYTEVEVYGLPAVE